MPQRFGIEIQTCHPAITGTGIEQICRAIRDVADRLEKAGALWETDVTLPDGTSIGHVFWHGLPYTHDQGCNHCPTGFDECGLPRA